MSLSSVDSYKISTHNFSKKEKKNLSSLFISFIDDQYNMLHCLSDCIKDLGHECPFPMDANVGFCTATPKASCQERENERFLTLTLSLTIF